MKQLLIMRLLQHSMMTKINGKKYTFDENGAMVAEWSLDIKKASSNLGTSNFVNVEKTGTSAKYSQAWRYFS